MGKATVGNAVVGRGGQARARTGDLSIFSRTLYQLSYLAQRTCAAIGPGASSATPTGLEPATSAVTGRRANQLRYGALCKTQDQLQEQSL